MIESKRIPSFFNEKYKNDSVRKQIMHIDISKF